jgi:hypothetical protein
MRYCPLSCCCGLGCRKKRFLTILLQMNVGNDEDSHSLPPFKSDGKRHAKCKSSKCRLVAHKDGCILRSLTSKKFIIYYLFRLYFDLSFFPTKSLPYNETLSPYTSYIPTVRRNSHLSLSHHLYWILPYLFPQNQPITIFSRYHPC